VANGFPTYNTLDYGGSVDPRNLDRRRASPVGTLVHTTGGINSLSWLIGGSAESGNPAGANYLIAKNGQRYKLCPDNKYPYHAGRSAAIIHGRRFTGNQVSELLIGVELECADTEQCTYEQLDSLAELLTKLSVDFKWRWPYTLLGHYEVALPVGRRSDPLGFQWGDFMGLLYARSKAANVPGL